MSTVAIIEIRGERFVLLPEWEYLNLRCLAGEEASLDPLLEDDKHLVDADEFVPEVIGRNLRKAREAAGLTQAQLGKNLGKSQAMVSAAERGKTEVGLRYWETVLMACGLAPNWDPREAPLSNAGRSPH